MNSINLSMNRTGVSDTDWGDKLSMRRMQSLDLSAIKDVLTTFGLEPVSKMLKDCHKMFGGIMIHMWTL